MATTDIRGLEGLFARPEMIGPTFLCVYGLQKRLPTYHQCDPKIIHDRIKLCGSNAIICLKISHKLYKQFI